MNRVHLYFLIASAFTLFFYPTVKQNRINDPPADSTVSITIAAVGDLMCHSVQYNYARLPSGDFDFNPCFEYVREELSSADFTFGNLETVTAGADKGYSGYPLFNAPDEYLDALKNSGFDMLMTSNNHALDRGEAGVRRTIDQLVKRGIHHNGTFLSEEDRDSVRLINIKGIKTALLSYTYGTNGNYIPKNKPYLINLIDTLRIASDIRKARELGSDIVIVYFHFGEEKRRIPDSFQESIVKSTISAGADIIIGSHPHMIQPVAYFKSEGGNLDTGLIAYSLGNFISNQRWRYSDAGVILFITISRDVNTNRFRLEKTEFLPTWVYKGNRTYKILPAGNLNLYSYLTPQDQHKMEEAFRDTEEMMMKLDNRPRLYHYVQPAVYEP